MMAHTSQSSVCNLKVHAGVFMATERKYQELEKIEKKQMFLVLVSLILFLKYSYIFTEGLITVTTLNKALNNLYDVFSLPPYLPGHSVPKIAIL